MKKRLTIFAGHYGSGKTNIAVNYALRLSESTDNVVIADLDIVNPYYRTKDSADVLRDHGIRLVSSEYANSNVDVPALPPDAYTITDDRSLTAIIDVGGDDRGALALGRYVPAILEENDYEMLAVINRFRPLTRDALSTVGVLREIEDACGVRFTGIVNNSNLGNLTTPETVLDSVAYGKEVAGIMGVPVRFTPVLRDLYDSLKNRIQDAFPIDIYVRAKI